MFYPHGSRHQTRMEELSTNVECYAAVRQWMMKRDSRWGSYTGVEEKEEESIFIDKNHTHSIVVISTANIACG